MPGPVTLASSGNVEYTLANGGQPTGLATLLAGEKLPNNAGDGYIDVGTNGIWWLLDVATVINVVAGVPNSGGASGVIGDSRILGVRYLKNATTPTLTITGCSQNVSVGTAASIILTPSVASATTTDTVTDMEWGGLSICNNFGVMTLTASIASIVLVCLRASGQVSP